MRPTTFDSYRERLNRVLIHIRNHLDEPLTIEKLAGIACLSPFHFHRIFTAFIGETVNNHVRRVRLEQAALRITTSGESMTEVALSVGYETPAAFSRAFRERLGVSPSAYRGNGQTAFPMVNNRSLAHGILPEPELREWPDTPVLCVSKTGAYDKAAAEAWNILMGFASQHRLQTKDSLTIGVSHDNPVVTVEELLRYDACISITEPVQLTGEIALKTIAGGQCAVFIHKGDYKELSAVYQGIFAWWLPASTYGLRDQPCFEVYLNRNPCRTKPENLRTEIWVPIA